ncbi:HEAT repeat domain-containing protein [Candidatus Micrarchaeota archaeon]|nr:HEAT repeat domain-containing protein [Candidatus Micrarchaeota archaeon]
MDLLEKLKEKNLKKVAEEITQQDPEKIVPALVELIENEEVRDNVCYMLAAIVNKNPESKAILNAIPVFIEMLDDTDNTIRANACFSLLILANYNPKNKDIVNSVPVLTIKLEDPEPSVRKNAAGTLVFIAQYNGKKVAEAIPALIKLLEDKTENVRINAANALAMSFQENSENKDLLNAASNYLQMFMEMMVSDSEIVQQNAALLIGYIAQKNPEAVLSNVTQFIQMLDNKIWRVRWNSIGILGLVLLKYPQEKEIVLAMPRFLELMEDENTMVRFNAVGIVGSLAHKNPKSKEISDSISRLIKALKDESGDIRLRASAWLPLIAENNAKYLEKSIPALRESLKDEDERLQKNIKKVLEKLGG